MKALLIFAAIICGVAKLVMVGLEKSGKKISPYVVFAVVDIIFGLLILAFAIYDFHTAVGEFAGILGELALIAREPIVGGLLLIDFIVWLVNKKKKSHE